VRQLRGRQQFQIFLAPRLRDFIQARPELWNKDIGV